MWNKTNDRSWYNAVGHIQIKAKVEAMFAVFEGAISLFVWVAAMGGNIIEEEGDIIFII